MSDDVTASRSERLNRPVRKRGPNAGAVAAIALLSGLGLGGAGVLYMQSQETAPSGAVLDTSTSQEFQEETTATNLRSVITPAPVLAPEPAGPSEAEIALRNEIDDLKEALAAARAAQEAAIPAATPASTVPEVLVDTTQIDELQRQLDDLAASVTEREDQLRAVEAERDSLATESLRKDAELEGMVMRLEQAQTDLLDDMAARDQAEEQKRAEDERRQELEQRRAEAEAIRQAQINSPIDGLSGGSSDGGTREYSGDEAFIRAGSDTISPTQSRIVGAPSNTVMQGTVIEATLTTGINSALSGTITSTVSYDIWSFDMRQVLIPRGSQMFGRYSNEVALGQERVLVAWDRVVTPDGQVVDLEAYGSDRLGRSGLTGRVDSRFLERFGAAAAVSIFSVLPALAADRSDDENTSDVAEQVGTDVRDATSSIVDKYLSLSPVITVEHGDVIMVMVTNDLELF